MSYVTGPKPASEPRGTSPAGTLVPNYTTGGRPRNGGYTSGIDFRSGLYAYVKSGRTAKYYNDSAGRNETNVTKGSNVKNAGAFAGITTGETGTSLDGRMLIQLKWVHSYNEARFLGIGNVKREYEMISYVYTDDVELRTAQTDDSLNIVDNRNPAPTPPPAGDGDSDTLLYAGAGLAAVMLLTPKERRK